MAYLTLKINFFKDISTQQHYSKNPLILYDDECVRCENQTGGKGKLPGNLCSLLFQNFVFNATWTKKRYPEITKVKHNIVWSLRKHLYMYCCCCCFSLSLLCLKNKTFFCFSIFNIICQIFSSRLRLKFPEKCLKSNHIR